MTAFGKLLHRPLLAGCRPTPFCAHWLLTGA